MSDIANLGEGVRSDVGPVLMPHRVATVVTLQFVDLELPAVPADGNIV